MKDFLLPTFVIYKGILILETYDVIQMSMHDNDER